MNTNQLMTLAMFGTGQQSETGDAGTGYSPFCTHEAKPEPSAGPILHVRTQIRGRRYPFCTHEPKSRSFFLSFHTHEAKPEPSPEPILHEEPKPAAAVTRFARTNPKARGIINQ
jgi:hypothetical protein